MNPGSANLAFIETALDCGVNRFSLGVQSFSETTLQQLQREHVPSDIFQTMTELRDCGATNVNLDLIYGVPNQTAQSFADDLDRLLSLSPNHVSLYNLQFEEGTGLRDRLDQGLVSELEEKTQIDMYNQACSKMDSEGMPQYEISSFSAPDKRCQHNLTYWRNEEYIGAGAGAYGFLSGTRYRNHCMVERYITSVDSGQAPRAEEDTLEDSQILVETLITGLRLREGIDWDDLEGRFTTEVTSRLREVCEGHIAAGLMERIGGAKARLTPAGLLVSNAIFETLV
jgi:oxygen-independent coproporphyrinogen-3 oxidase